ncbi:MAG: MobQ family relaxase [Pseudomonadota bacterium]
MALFSMRIQQIKRSQGRSVIAAAAYRAGEKLFDARQGMTHDYSRRSGVEHTEILLPTDAPDWIRGLDREELWNQVDAAEKRKDAQTARELRIMIPRELDPPERIRVVREFVQRCFVDKGMVADVCWHNKTASDGREQPHAHVMLTMRHLTPEGFGLKSRHDWVPDPSGRTHPDGRPVMIESNAESWNSAAYYERCREDWEKTANRALERAGSSQRIDRRSLLERGIARMPEPALRLAWYMRDLYGVMRQRFGQFQVARHYRAVETRAKEAFRAAGNNSPARVAERYFAWFDRQLARLAPAAPERSQTHNPPTQERNHDR